MRGPDFGGQKELVALDAGAANALSHLALVVVDFCGIDVAVAEPQRLLDHPRAGPAAQFPGAKTNQGNFCSLGLDAWYRCDRIHVSPGSIPFRRLRRADDARIGPPELADFRHLGIAQLEIEAAEV